MGFGDFLRGAGSAIQGMAEKANDRAADIIWRKFHGDVETLRRIARGEHPTANSAGVRAAQNALEKHGYRW